MSQQRALDVAALPTFAFGNRSILWWGTMGIVAIEGTMFAIVSASYLFLRWRVPEWPPALSPPELRWGTATTILLLISALPNHWAKHAAEKMDLERVRLWMVVCIALALIFTVFRVMEFRTLNCWYDTNAYASVVWLLLGLHTVHILTDVIDTSLLAALMFVGPIEGRRFVDVAENSLYWYFVVASWLPIYALIYFAPRVL
jgi:cytochrome c oxidase subunit III